MQKKIPVRVYTDYKSPYAFVAKDPTYALAEKYQLELDWYPYTLRIQDYLGTLETRNAHQWRRVRYSYMDARRLANVQGLVLKGPERVYNGYYANVIRKAERPIPHLQRHRVRALLEARAGH